MPIVTLSLNGDVYKSLCNFNLNKTNRILYLGGISQSHSNLILPDFKGIISHLKLNEKKLDLFSDSYEKKNVNSFNTCHNVDCENSGICITTQNDIGFRCKCVESYEGVFCERKNFERFCEKFNPCKNNGKCEELRNDNEKEANYKCECSLGYTGRNCTKSSLIF